MENTPLRLRWIDDTLKRIADALEYFVEEDKKNKSLKVYWRCDCGWSLEHTGDCKKEGD